MLVLWHMRRQKRSSNPTSHDTLSCPGALHRGPKAATPLSLSVAEWLQARRGIAGKGAVSAGGSGPGRSHDEIRQALWRVGRDVYTVLSV